MTENTTYPADIIGNQPFLLGLFLPIYKHGWTVSTAERGTDWGFDYNAGLVRTAEDLGFDLTFGFANWLGREGYGGAMRYREDSLDALATAAALTAITRRIAVIATIHPLYNWHPLNAARIGATLDHISGGRFGFNLVTGFKPGEAQMFGRAQALPHAERYAALEEFATIAERLWQRGDELTYSGNYWSTEKAWVSPACRRGRPLMVSAASSDTGLRYAARHSDIVFITSPGGADINAALETLPALNARVKAFAREEGREIRTLINPHIICRETEAEVDQIRRHILSGADYEALDAVMEGFSGGDQSAWRGHAREERIIGGNIQIFGTPEQVTEQCLRLKQAGCDGIQINFFDYVPDLAFFGSRVLPLLHQAGLRN